MAYIDCMKEITSRSKTRRKNLSEEPVSVQELRLGMVHAARLVRRYGMIYWPIVERLKSEVAMIEERETLLKKLLNDERY